MSGEKICAICGEDCRDRPRTKDRAGRYFCTACYDAARRPPSIDPDRLELGAPADVDPARLEPAAPAAVPAPDPDVASAPIAESSHPAELRWQWWPVYLYFRPWLFFRAFTANSSPMVIAIFAWVFGIAGVIDRVQTREVARQFGGRPPLLPDSWPVHWGVYLGGGILGGLIFYSIGGWWYRTRLRYCGDADADPALARRVYILASLVAAFPMVIFQLIETARFGRPSDALSADLSVLDVLLLVSVFWSVWASFAGVRAVFDTGRIRAIIWFLALPIAWYGLVIAGALIAMLFIASPPPDVAHPQAGPGSTFRFDFPGNWWIDTQDPDHDPESWIAIEAWQDAVVRIMVYESESSVAEEVSVSADSIRGEADRASAGRSFKRYGAYEGVGRSFTAFYDSIPIETRVFVADLGDGRYLEVNEFCATADISKVRPGFRQIEQSLTVR